MSATTSKSRCSPACLRPTSLAPSAQAISSAWCAFPASARKPRGTHCSRIERQAHRRRFQRQASAHGGCGSSVFDARTRRSVFYEKLTPFIGCVAPKSRVLGQQSRVSPIAQCLSAGIASSKVGTCSWVRKRKSPTCQIHNSWTCLRSKLQPVDRKPYVHVPSLRSPIPQSHRSAARLHPLLWRPFSGRHDPSLQNNPA